MKIEWALWPALASASSSLKKGMSHTVGKLYYIPNLK